MDSKENVVIYHLGDLTKPGVHGMLTTGQLDSIRGSVYEVANKVYFVYICSNGNIYLVCVSYQPFGFMLK